MKEHAQSMLRFSSTFKALMYSCGIENSDQIDQFLETENASTLDQGFFNLISKLEKKSGLFLNNLRHCACSEIRPARDNQKVTLYASTYAGEEGFCYHSPLSPEISQKYRQLIELCQTRLTLSKSNFPTVFQYTYIFNHSLDTENLKQFNAFFLNPDQLAKLENFEICRCINIAHSKLNFHSAPFGDNVFLPAFVASAKLLGNVWWSQQILDLSKTTYDDKFFEEVELRQPDAGMGSGYPFSRAHKAYVKGQNENYFNFQRLLLFHQGNFSFWDSTSWDSMR